MEKTAAPGRFPVAGFVDRQGWAATGADEHLIIEEKPPITRTRGELYASCKETE
jgi:hypothetical protein